jgi:hypothetical protein
MPQASGLQIGFWARILVFCKENDHGLPDVFLLCLRHLALGLLNG